MRGPARILAALLCALVAVAPVEGKRYDAPNAKSTNAAGSTASQKKKKKTESASNEGGFKSILEVVQRPAIGYEG